MPSLFINFFVFWQILWQLPKKVHIRCVSWYYWSLFFSSFLMKNLIGLNFCVAEKKQNKTTKTKKSERIFVPQQYVFFSAIIEQHCHITKVKLVAMLLRSGERILFFSPVAKLWRCVLKGSNGPVPWTVQRRKYNLQRNRNKRKWQLPERLLILILIITKAIWFPHVGQ